jgi:hypothetical protein
MQTITAEEVAKHTKIPRHDWVHGAANLVVANEVQYDRSTPHSKEALICRDNILADVDLVPLVNKWLDGAECCDCRDELNELIYNEASALLKQMADDYGVGV